MEKAIEKAIQGGFKNIVRASDEDVVGAYVRESPLFWQALGKAEGWAKSHQRVDLNCGHGCCEEVIDALLFKQKNPNIWEEIKDGEKYDEDGMTYTSYWTLPQWKTEWHRFIDHIAEGGSVDEFFNNLLK